MYMQLQVFPPEVCMMSNAYCCCIRFQYMAGGQNGVVIVAARQRAGAEYAHDPAPAQIPHRCTMD